MNSESEKRLHLFVKGVRLGKKGPTLSLELRPQVHAIVARSEDQGDDFVRCCSGMTQPRRGKIQLGETEPGKTPELRARIGSLLGTEPPLGDWGTVKDYLGYVLALRHRSELGAGSPLAAKDVSHVADLLDRSTISLTNQERRRVALGLVLSIERPALLVLNNPLADLDGTMVSSLLEHLGQLADEGAIVACVVPTERSARQIAERTHHLEASLDGGPNISFLIRSERTRDVASSLARSHSITSTQIRPSGDLLVSGTSEESAAADITQALCATQVEVFEVRRVSSEQAKYDA